LLHGLQVLPLFTSEISQHSIIRQNVHACGVELSVLIMQGRFLVIFHNINIIKEK